ncbi:MAG: SlyX family protein [Desulfovibrio sp.]|nr:SlyX family protein [Desulfovibrio sp.]
MQERLNRLEENSYFQEKLLGDLNQALLEQQQQIDHLSRVLEKLSQDVEELKILLDEKPQQQLPPHYLPKS